jgi:mannose-6-phosphate isomerase-like protein (cupin superfamily)
MDNYWFDIIYFHLVNFLFRSKIKRDIILKIYNKKKKNLLKRVKIIILNLKEKCLASNKKEFFYGAKINKAIQDVYLGLCFLEPGESKRKVGPGKGHEEILYLMEGQIQISINNNEILLNQGEIFFIPDGSKALLKNLTKNSVQFIIAGGHTKHHSH